MRLDIIMSNELVGIRMMAVVIWWYYSKCCLENGKIHNKDVRKNKNQAATRAV
jgi:hypothetical protein